MYSARHAYKRLILGLLFFCGTTVLGCSTPGEQFRERMLESHPVNTLILSSSRHYLREGESTRLSVLGMSGRHQFSLNNYVDYQLTQSHYGILDPLNYLFGTTDYGYINSNHHFVATTPTPPEGIKIRAFYEQQVDDVPKADPVLKSNTVVIHVLPESEKTEFPTPEEWKEQKEEKREFLNQ